MKTLPVLGSALAVAPQQSSASENASKVSLVVGNSAYPRMQLRNSVNDAHAVSDLLASAGFSVDIQLEATQRTFIEAIRRFGSTVKRGGTKLAVFYYAGHGVQLDWRNYLLPVDAQVSSGDELKARCIDMGLLLDTFADAKATTHVVILDACRNDPFSGSYKPAQSGLSQVDAPVGSLLAYSTSPGSVAFDGERENGLYTENLVREWSRRDANLENALKRVRLNVRLESQGRQVPWESTSLESDIFIFEDGRKHLTDAELENYVKEDLAVWERIKSSQNADDWVEYLRAFPDGRFAEIAQFRLTRLLALKQTKSASAAVAGPTSAAQATVNAPATPVNTAALAPLAASSPLAATSAPAAATAAPATVAALATVAVLPSPAAAASLVSPTASANESTVPAASAAAAASSGLVITDRAAIEIAPGKPAPQLMSASGNPFSAGTYPLGRIYSVGDKASFTTTDILTGRETDRYSIRITKVDMDADRVEGNNGQWVFDSMGNMLVTPLNTTDVPRLLVPAEFQIGKKWSAAFSEVHGKWSTEIDLKIVAREAVRAAGVDFEAFRVEIRGMSGNLRLEWRYWYVPGINFAVKWENIARRFFNEPIVTNRSELVTLQQQKTGFTSTEAVGAIPAKRAAQRFE
ncbi:caspase family protein [Paraburkholderia unamae]|uniref:caspase family protein n=1 Tax=Paraburkholderia unamae TaxID=219649 RepID=UPI001CC7284C|nr:caspase family protein [Paraburkholderia unamae]